MKIMMRSMRCAAPDRRTVAACVTTVCVCTLLLHGCATLDEALQELEIPDLTVPTTTTTTSTTTTTLPPDQAEATLGFSHPAPIVANIEYVGISKSGIRFRAGKRYWEVIDGCDGEAWLFVKRGGKWQGAKFDHVRPSSTSRDFKNLNPADPYGKWKSLGVPQSGEPVAFMVINYKHNERSNAVFAGYP